jgi:polygalacturonase
LPSKAGRRQGIAELFRLSTNEAWRKKTKLGEVKEVMRLLLVENVTCHTPQEWTHHYVGCDFLTIRGVHIHAHGNANGDGIDIDGCQDVIMSDCVIDADDNALIFKGRSARDCRNITVQGCVLASKITAIKTGTESGGGFQNIVINNCIIRSSYEEHHVDPNRQQMNGSGIALETTDGGHLDGIIISNIVMEECLHHSFLRRGTGCDLTKMGLMDRRRSQVCFEMSFFQILFAKKRAQNTPVLLPDLQGIHSKYYA